MKRTFFAIAILAAALMAAPLSYAHELPQGFHGFEMSTKCQGCHADIYAEWEGSMHANSSKFKDPVHAALFDAFSSAMVAKGKKPNYHCSSCHTPTAPDIRELSTGAWLPSETDPTHVDGVTCAFCHMVSEVVEGKSFNTYKVTEGIKGGTKDSKAPHGVVYSEFNSSYKMCLGCHSKKIAGTGAVICSMDEEGVSDCLPCHMPETEGAPAVGSDRTTHAFHGIHGAHDPAMLEKGASVTLAQSEGGVKVTLENPNTHYFPSTNPLRMAFLKVVATDKDGKVVFENFTDDPMTDPQAVLIKLFKAGDKVGVPSWDAEGVARDTRLKPGEERELSYAIPDTAENVSAKLFYRFASPKAVDKFKMPHDGVVDVPHLVSGAELVISEPAE